MENQRDQVSYKIVNKKSHLIQEEPISWELIKDKANLQLNDQEFKFNFHLLLIQNKRWKTELIEIDNIVVDKDMFQINLKRKKAF